MLFLTVAAVILTTSSIPIRTAFAAYKDEHPSCDVNAWVRAEDLSPNAIVNGDLRIKVDQGCTDEVASVSLELRLDEFSEVRYLKEGATLPTLRPNCWGICRALDDPDYDKYYELLRDPALWVAKAEERTAFKSVVTLIEKPFDYSQPVVVPFTVAVPNVNYPPVPNGGGYSLGSDTEPETHSKRAYRYTALIAFQSGHKVIIPAGFTTFDPVHDASLPTRAFSTNVTFEEETWGSRDHFDNGTADMEKTIFGAQVTLEGGNVVRTGDTIRGRVVVHRLTNGSATAQDVSINVRSKLNHRWAQAQAALGAFPLSDSSFSSPFYDSEISTSSPHFDYILRREGRRHSRWELSNTGGALTEQKQYLDFEWKLSEDAIRNFDAYYVTSDTSLVIDLYVSGEDKEPVENTNRYEEGLWDDGTPVGQPLREPDYPPKLGYAPTQRLVAKIPITLIGAPSLSSGPPPIHYLTPGVASPVVLASPPPSYKDVVFPVSQPIITPEPAENTVSRLLSSQVSRIVESIQVAPDPSRDYLSGSYAGLLWKKKMMAEHMARVVVPTAEEDAPYYDSSDFQVVL